MTAAYRDLPVPLPPFLDEQDERAAMGAVLTTMTDWVTGRWPMPSQVLAAVDALTHRPPPPPRAIQAGVSHPLHDRLTALADPEQVIHHPFCAAYPGIEDGPCSCVYGLLAAVLSAVLSVHHPVEGRAGIVCACRVGRAYPCDTIDTVAASLAVSNCENRAPEDPP